MKKQSFIIQMKARTAYRVPSCGMSGINRSLYWCLINHASLVLLLILIVNGLNQQKY